MASTTLYHGSHSNETLVVHEGLCLTDDVSVAEQYATRLGYLHEVEIDLDGLTVEECGGYDHDADECPADDENFRHTAASRGVDILMYEDEDVCGRQHTCWRLVSERALAAVAIAAE